MHTKYKPNIPSYTVPKLPKLDVYNIMQRFILGLKPTSAPLTLTYETCGTSAWMPDDLVVMVSSVVMPRVTLPGTESTSIQNDTHEIITIRMVGM